MKRFITFLIAVFISSSSFAQYWILKSSADLSVADGEAVYSFTIDSMAYYQMRTASRSFIAYNINTNTWTYKADFPVSNVQTNTGFVINGLGYVNVSGGNGFYQYNPSTDSWIAKAAYPDTGVSGSYAFAIDTLGYLVSGRNNISGALTVKCYKYNPSNDNWTRLNNITWPGGGMESGTSGAINGKGYCCTGTPVDAEFFSPALLEYDPASDSWTSEANYPGSSGSPEEQSPPGCIFGNKIYMTDGYDLHSWIYDPTTNLWYNNQLPRFPAPCGYGDIDATSQAICFNINNHVFIGYQLEGPSLCGPNPNTDYFYELDTSIHFSLLSYSPPDSTCENYPITVTFSSNAAFAADNNFRLLFINSSAYKQATSDSIPGTQGGTYTFRVPTGTIYSADIAQDSFCVVSSDPAITFDGPAVFMNVMTGVLQQPFAPAYSVCNGAPAQLIGVSPNHADNPGGDLEWYYWANSPGDYNVIPDTFPSKSIYSNVNTAWYFKSVNITDGCMFLDTIAITVVAASPAPNLPVTSVAICAGDSFTFGGAPVPGYSYLWDGPGINSNASFITVSPATVGNYSLLVSDSGCEVEYNLTASVNPLLAQPICFVTVDTTSSYNVVIWEKTNKYATDSFYIYREITTDNYQRVGAVGGGDLSEFNDYSSNPNVASYQYKLSALDTCGNEGELSHFHNTIHLEYLGSGNLIWNAYVIDSETTPVNSFDVYRDSAGNGNWQLLISLPGNETVASDPNFSQNPNARYRVTANWAYSCVPSRSSGTEVESNIIYLRASGINELKEYSSLLYPNPAKDLLTVESSFFTTGKMDVVMYDLTGETISTSYKQEQDKLTFNTSGLTAGIYFLKFSIDGRNLNSKFVKIE